MLKLGRGDLIYALSEEIALPSTVLNHSEQILHNNPDNHYLIKQMINPSPPPFRYLPPLQPIVAAFR